MSLMSSKLQDLKRSFSHVECKLSKTEAIVDYIKYCTWNMYFVNTWQYVLKYFYSWFFMAMFMILFTVGFEITRIWKLSV